MRLLQTKRKWQKFRILSIDDILPRPIVKKPEIDFGDTSIMITGAGGSIGSEIVRQVIEGRPKKIVLFEMSEINLYSIESEVNAMKQSMDVSTQIVGILGDVKNQNRMENIIETHQVDLIYHAAAYKHVPIVEYHENISEGIKNNIFGTPVCVPSIIKLQRKKTCGYFY